MALRKSALSEIPQRNKDLIFGFVKESEKKNKTSVPEMIKYLCLIYLNQNKDMIDPKLSQDRFNVDGDMIQHNADEESNAYFTNIASTGIHIWKFKCIKMDLSDVIGIVNINLSDHPQNDYFDDYNDTPEGKIATGYGFNLRGWLTHNHGWGNNYGTLCNDNDVIEMTLNMNKLTLSFKINGTGYGIAFNIIDSEYRAVMYVEEQGSCYSLVSYQHIY